MAGPYDLNDTCAYAAWRERKLDTAPRRIEDIVVTLDDPRQLKTAERASLVDLNRRCNMAIYISKTGTDPDKEIPRRLGQQLGMTTLDGHWLTDDDGISPISVIGAERRSERKEFIPYTNKPIRWHTDGYYNTPDHTIRSLLLHCVQSGATGGTNRLLDHEIAYILLRDEDPDHIRALSSPNAMTIPPRTDGQGVARAAQSGPVFSVNDDGTLHMRYTARSISIAWSAAAVAARTALERILATPTPWTLHGRLEPGMGLVSNNVLHDRSGFTETSEKRRLLYRARYYERIAAC